VHKQLSPNIPGPVQSWWRERDVYITPAHLVCPLLLTGTLTPNPTQPQPHRDFILLDSRNNRVSGLLLLQYSTQRRLDLTRTSFTTSLVAGLICSRIRTALQIWETLPCPWPSLACLALACTVLYCTVLYGSIFTPLSVLAALFPYVLSWSCSCSCICIHPSRLPHCFPSGSYHAAAREGIRRRRIALDGLDST